VVSTSFAKEGRFEGERGAAGAEVQDGGGAGGDRGRERSEGENHVGVEGLKAERGERW
jgi:hypothetical protein